MPFRQQSIKSWRQYCQQNQNQKQQQQQLGKNNQEHQHHHHHKVVTNNHITGLLLSFELSSRKLSTRSAGREEISKLTDCNRAIKSMKVIDISNDQTFNCRRLNYLSKLASFSLSFLVISLYFASHANFVMSTPNTGTQTSSELNLNNNREMLDRLAQGSFTRNINQQAHHFLKSNNILNQQTNNQPIVTATQHQQNSNLVQTLPVRLTQLETESGGNSQFARLLSNQQQQEASASNSEPVWTSNEPIMNEQNSFVSNPSASNHKNYNLGPVSNVDSFPGLALEQQPVGKQQHHHQQHQYDQYFSYRPLASLKPTAPSINRQIIPPPSFYELALTPINTVQLEQVLRHGPPEPESSDNKETLVGLASSQQARQNGARSLNAHHQLLHQPVEPNLLPMNPTERSNMFQQQAFEPNFGVSSLNLNSKKEIEQVQNSENNQPKNANEDNKSNSSNGNGNGNNNNAGETSKVSIDNDNNNKNNNNNNELQVVDKAIEPRQKRRIFNRILKKAEWNHLFVELSKVFLRYFLDLALKDIIGKQSGGDTTTSRKKLDAQSELTDLLKDFVKTAISNI